jgi:DICT domain-containing protein
MPNDTALSLFHSLHQTLNENFATTKITKDSLITLSHLLENIVLTKGITGLILTGFQNRTYWQTETERYDKLAERTNTVCIFATDELPNANENIIATSLLPDDALEREWFLIIVSINFSILLCAKDHLLKPEKDSDGKFDVFLSFDPAHIVTALDNLERTVTLRNSPRLLDFKLARKTFIPGSTQPYYFNLILGQFMEYLDKYNQVYHQFTKERTTRTLVSELLHETSQPVTALMLTLQMSQMTNQLSPEDIESMQQAVQSLHERILKLRQALSQKETLQPHPDRLTRNNGEEMIG